jgi:ABC-type Fe3+-siderophore transport system permease subunit
MADRTRVATLVVGSVLTIAGIVILLIGLRYATATDVPVDDTVTTRALAAIFLGAVMFAVGGMMALVGIVRPRFGKRPIDERASKQPRRPDCHDQ